MLGLLSAQTEIQGIGQRRRNYALDYLRCFACALAARSCGRLRVRWFYTPPTRYCIGGANNPIGIGAASGPVNADLCNKTATSRTPESAKLLPARRFERVRGIGGLGLFINRVEALKEKERVYVSKQTETTRDQQQAWPRPRR